MARSPNPKGGAEQVVSSVAHPRDDTVGIVEGARELLQIGVPLGARQAALEHLADFAHRRGMLTIDGALLVFRRVLNAAQVQNGLDQGDVGGAEFALARWGGSRRKTAQQPAQGDGSLQHRGP